MISELFDLSQRIVLITGSARGLGFTIARGMAQAGAAIVLNDVVKDKLDESVKVLRDEGLNAFGYLFDITDPVAVAKNVEAIEQEVGPIDILFNNAGIQIRHPLEEFPEEDWERILKINLTGVYGFKVRGTGNDYAATGQNHKYVLDTERTGAAHDYAVCRVQRRS